MNGSRFSLIMRPSLVLVHDALIKLSTDGAADICSVNQPAIAPTPLVPPCSFACTLCGKDEPSYQALAAHLARTHGVLREARTRIMNGKCAVCLRNFHSRERCIEHVHKASPICLMNTLLFLPRLSPDVIAKADEEQKARGMAARARRENPVYAQQIVRQGFGPVQPFIIPIGHSRESRFKMFSDALKDPETAISADFGALKAAIKAGSMPEIVNLVPFEMLPRLSIGG